MRTYEDKTQQIHERRLSGCALLLTCLRYLHPGVQFDQGCGFFLYLVSIGTTVAGVTRLLSGKADSAVLLLVSLTLWICLLLGNLLVILWEPAALLETDRADRPVTRPTPRGKRIASGNRQHARAGSNGTEKDRQGSLEAADHDNA